MPHSIPDSLDSTSIYSVSRPMTTAASANTAAQNVVGTALTKRDSRVDVPSQSQQKSEEWKRTSSPIAEAYADLIGSGGGNIDELLRGRRGGDRTSMGQHNNVQSQRRSQWDEEQLRYKDLELGTIKERVQKESPVIAELRTNVIIKDEFTLVTDLSYHLAQRYTRPDSSIMIKVDHSACLALGGTFDPCYILTITALPSQMDPSTNQRNAAMIQSFMAEILSVSSDRGIIKFQPIGDYNYAMNGTTMAGRVEKLEKHQGENSPSAVRKAITNGIRKSAAYPPNPPRHSLKDDRRSLVNIPKIDTDVHQPNGAPDDLTPIARKRRSASAEPHSTSAIPNVFELSGTNETEWPATSGGETPAAVNGLRMNGISKEDLGASRRSSERPKTIAGQSPHRSAREEMPKNERRMSSQSTRRQPATTATSSSSTRDHRKSSNYPVTPRLGAITISPKPSAKSTMAATTDSKFSPLTVKDTYLDGVTISPPKSSARTYSTMSMSARIDPKLDAMAAEKNFRESRETAANTAKRRSTVTATPRMPAPPPIPVERERKELKSGKRKSFLGAFWRSTSG